MSYNGKAKYDLKTIRGGERVEDRMDVIKT
jgi:hypothetical protein